MAFADRFRVRVLVKVELVALAVVVGLEMIHSRAEAAGVFARWRMRKPQRAACLQC
jgi:hypothetical protein